MPNNFSLILFPYAKPPKFPLFEITLWQGIIIIIGFLLHAEPTALCDFVKQELNRVFVN